MIKMNTTFLTLNSNLKKIIVGLLALFFALKLSMIAGFELTDYKKIISGSFSDNIIYLDEIKKDRARFFSIMREELIDNLKEGKSVDLTVRKIKRELTKPYLLLDSKSRQEILILASSTILAAKKYAVNHQITEDQLKSIQYLFKDYMSLKVEVAAGLLKRDGILFVPEREEVTDFLSPSFTMDSFQIENKKQEDELKTFNKL